MTVTPEIKRLPIFINEHTVAMVTLFIKPHDFIEDSWAWEFSAAKARESTTYAAEQVISAFGDRVSPLFMKELRRAATKWLQEHDSQFGTSFAQDPTP